MDVVKVVGGFLEIEGAGIGGARPDQSLPSGGARPGHDLPQPPVTTWPPPGGTPVPPQIWPTPPQPLPPQIASQIVVAVHRPGQDWVVRAYDPAYVSGGPVPGQPTPVG